MNKNEIIHIIESKYPEFPIELLKLIVQYIKLEILESCRNIIRR